MFDQNKSDKPTENFEPNSRALQEAKIAEPMYSQTEFYVQKECFEPENVLQFEKKIVKTKQSLKNYDVLGHAYIQP